MMIGWGLPLGLQKDCLASQGLYADEAKIAAGIPRVMPEALVKKKIAAYADQAGLVNRFGGRGTAFRMGAKGATPVPGQDRE
jgi:phosphosulfolactate synthase (CoM biosynthesis protein A)